MKKSCLLLAIAIIGFTVTSKAQNTQEKIWVTIQDQANIPYEQDGKLVSNSQSIQNLISNYNINFIEQALSNSRNEDLQKVYELGCDCLASELANEIMNNVSDLLNPEIAPNYQLLSVPDDKLLQFPTDYALDLINANDAWDYSIGDSTQILGISDGNYYIDHEDLADSYVSYDTNNTSTYYAHGTAVATAAAGSTNNGLGKSSIGYNCKMDLVGMNYNSIIGMSNNGIKVINVSWMSSCSPSNYVQNVMNEVYENGTIIVAAAGNGSCGGAANLVYPAACENVLAISSVGPTNNHEGVIGDSMSCHQHNYSVDLCAPGYLVALTVSPGVYTYGNGSSFAAPYVTGTIGLIQSLRPCLSVNEITDIILSTAKNIDSLNPNYAGLLGAGTLDAGAALAKAFNDYSCDVPVAPVDSLDFNAPGTEATISESNNSTAGIEDIEISKIGLFPNPTSQNATLNLGKHGVLDLTIIDPKGRVIQTIIVDSQTESVSIEVENQGVYFINLSSAGNTIWMQRLVKL